MHACTLGTQVYIKHENLRDSDLPHLMEGCQSSNSARCYGRRLYEEICQRAWSNFTHNCAILTTAKRDL